MKALHKLGFSVELALDIISEVYVFMDIQATDGLLKGRHEDLLFCAWVRPVAREGVADDGVVAGECGANVRHWSPGQLALWVRAKQLNLTSLSREGVERWHRGVIQFIRGSIDNPGIKIIKKKLSSN